MEPLVARIGRQLRRLLSRIGSSGQHRSAAGAPVFRGKGGRDRIEVAHDGVERQRDTHRILIADRELEDFRVPIIEDLKELFVFRVQWIAEAVIPLVFLAGAHEIIRQVLKHGRLLRRGDGAGKRSDQKDACQQKGC